MARLIRSPKALWRKVCCNLRAILLCTCGFTHLTPNRLSQADPITLTLCRCEWKHSDRVRALLDLRKTAGLIFIHWPVTVRCDIVSLQSSCITQSHGRISYFFEAWGYIQQREVIYILPGGSQSEAVLHFLHRYAHWHFVLQLEQSKYITYMGSWYQFLNCVALTKKASIYMSYRD